MPERVDREIAHRFPHVPHQRPPARGGVWACTRAIGVGELFAAAHALPAIHRAACTETRSG